MWGIYQTDSSTQPAKELFQLYTPKVIRIKKEILYAFCKKGLEDRFTNIRLKRSEKNNINVTEKRIKIWKIIITYNEGNHNNIKSKIITSGYKAKHNDKKMYYSLGPFSDISHAKEESNKLKNLHGLKNKIIDLSF